MPFKRKIPSAVSADEPTATPSKRIRNNAAATPISATPKSAVSALLMQGLIIGIPSDALLHLLE